MGDLVMVRRSMSSFQLVFDVAIALRWDAPTMLSRFGMSGCHSRLRRVRGLRHRWDALRWPCSPGPHRYGGRTTTVRSRVVSHLISGGHPGPRQRFGIKGVILAEAILAPRSGGALHQYSCARKEYECVIGHGSRNSATTGPSRSADEKVLRDG
jgi:hypothetical protein